MFDGLEENKLQIDKGINEYIGYIIGEKNACAIHYLLDYGVAYIHNMPPNADEIRSEDSNVPVVEEKIFFVIETVNGEYCDDEGRYKGKVFTNAYGAPLKGEYSVSSWFINEQGELCGIPVQIGLLELEINDQSGENAKKVIEYLADYAKRHDFWLIYEEHEEVMSEVTRLHR